MNWLSDPRAAFVLAAYSAAFLCLFIIGISSLWAYKKRAREWRALGRDVK